MTTGRSADRIPILYLMTTELSSVLVKGQLAYLTDQGFDVTVGTLRTRPQQPPESGKWDDGVTVEHLPFAREPSPVVDLRALWATIRLIRNLRPTIVNASTPKAGLLGMLAARLCRVPVRVYQVRGFRFETSTGWRRRLYLRLERLAVRCANEVIFNSQSLMAVGETEGVIRPGGGQVLGTGSGNGIEIMRFAPDELPTSAAARSGFGLPADAQVIGFVGRFTKDKGVEDLVEVFEKSFKDSTNTWLLLVGQFEHGDPVSTKARAAIESNERVIVVPWLDDLRSTYAAIDVLAFPSFREGMPNVPLEAQLCGVPVVGYSATGTIDAVADHIAGALVKVGDRHALATALQDALRPPVRDSTAELAAWVTERFDRQARWESLLRTYRSAMSGRIRWSTQQAEAFVNAEPLGFAPGDRCGPT